MSDLVPGKRYRWTVEGVGNARGSLVIAPHTAIIDSELAAAGTVEQLPDPLPTAPGSVVRSEGRTYIRADSSHSMRYWLDERGAYAKASELANATVLFDAGATQ